MPRAKRAWSKDVEESGLTVRVYERAMGSLLYREVWINSTRDRKSLGHRDRALALQQARSLAKRLAELRMLGHTGSVTLGQLWRLYQQHRLPQLSPGRQVHARQHAAFWLAYLTDAFAVENFGQTQVDGFLQARKSGALRAKNRPEGPVTVRDDTVRQNLNWLGALFRWARGYKVKGRPLLGVDPFYGLTLPREKNVRRPVASEARYQQSLAQAATVDPTGRLACLLALTRYTGRRINAICQLRASDVLLSADAVTRALAARGQDPTLASYMPHGAIVWRPETDKIGYEDVAPISSPARTALEAYLGAQPRIGDAPLFPKRQAPARPMSKMDASYLLRRAETAAKLPKLERGLFHPYRRLFAVERKHLPDVDVARAAGWRDLATMKRSYQQADPATTLRAIENPTQSATSARPAARKKEHR